VYSQEWGWTNESFDTTFTVAFGDTTSQDVFMGFLHQVFSSGVDANATYTGDHVGFYIEDGTLNTSSADGTTQETNDISSGITLTNYNVYRIVWTAGTDVKFY